MAPVFGVCHICGKYTKLSFEHVPPRKAFNDKPVLRADIYKLMSQKMSDPMPIKDQQQKGFGDYTLCDKCNNDTGGWYGSAYISWVYQGMRLLDYTLGRPSLYYPFNFYPLRAIKQIICMFLSSCGPEPRDVHPDLVKFILNKESRFLPLDVKVFAFYNISMSARISGVSVLVNPTGIYTYGEIAYPPYGFVLALNSKPPDMDLLEITYFSRFKYNDWKTIGLHLPTRSVYSYLPGDYRSKDEIDVLEQSN